MHCRFVFGLVLSAVLSASQAFAAPTKVLILSATVKDQKIEGAEVILQKNGEASLKATTDSSGAASFDAPFGGKDDANVSMIVKKAGYSDLVVKCPCASLSYAISPNMADLDGLRVVLNWGEAPADLDAHVVYEKSHVFFSQKRGDGANLDVDDVNSYGPETITLDKKKPGAKYLFGVHNYTEGNTKGSPSLSNTSQAKVFVYIGSSLVRTFVPPKGRAGNVWVVFGIGENGEFYDINKFADVASRTEVGDFLTSLIAKDGFQSVPEVSVDQTKVADDLNKQGEQAYHAGKLDESARLYLSAIDNNPEHGQAYSNLGLAYQKLGRNAEALWANRKAIALASGKQKETIQASSYYNIARVYEDQQNWAQALKNYEEALKKKQNPAYAKGIDKMKAKLK